ncbi:hypothetical protein TIFTF001_010609 [Ficus carica]|uniref:Uncharacterized protein n=1 Tax=Ficus carica TaxID=3494 RepID=A0AA88A8X5_FICCA|nr:hypothetical protein TIFTF001_010609 [Ficus carica]
MCVEPFKDCVRRLVSDDVSEEPVSCLISDAVSHFTQAVAESLKLPRIVLRTAKTRLEDPVVELPPLKVKDLPMINTLNIESFSQFVDELVSTTKASSGLIWNTFEDLEHSSLATLSQQFSVPIFPIGPIHKHNLAIPSRSSSLLAEDQTSIPWLNTQPPKSVVYVSFGSIVAISKQEFLEIAWGLAKSEQPFFLSRRGHIVKWAPQQEVLAHKSVGAFWTHNGWNSTLESVSEGVPTICMPCFSDQKVNARFVSQVWKAGLQLENGKLERGEIEKIIRKLMMREQEGDEIRVRVSELKEKADKCLKQGGSSYESLERLVSHIFSLETFTCHSQRPVRTVI